MSELDKLEKYLLDHRITYERYEVHEEWDGPAGLTFEMDRHQICVPEEDEARTCGNCNHSTIKATTPQSTKDEQEKRIKADYESITKLIDNRNKIKLLDYTSRDFEEVWSR